MSFWLMVYEPKEDNEHFLMILLADKIKTCPLVLATLMIKHFGIIHQEVQVSQKGLFTFKQIWKKHLKTMPRSRFTKGFREKAACFR